MYCKYCGKEIEESAEICVHCGRRLRSPFASFLDNNEVTRLRAVRDKKSPGLAGFLGFLLGWLFLGPLGYLYLGQWNWFWITLVITLLAYPLTAGLAYVIFPFIFGFHQYQMAKDLNDMSKTDGEVQRPAEG